MTTTIIKCQSFSKEHKKTIKYFSDKYSSGRYLADINPVGTEPSNPVIKTLIDIASEYGYVRYDCHHYSPLSFIPICGSSKWHDDEGIGHLLTWVLDLQDLKGYIDATGTSCQLITRQQVLNLHVGDVFIFNGDVNHAWISNHYCLLAQMSVRKSRKKQP